MSQTPYIVGSQRVKQDCPTRWNSTYDMLRRFSKSKESLQSTIGILNNTTLPILTPEDWYIIETCSDILFVFNEITVEISAEKNVSLSKIAILSKNLLSYCSRLKNETFESACVTNMVNKLYDEVVNRFKIKYKHKHNMGGTVFGSTSQTAWFSRR